MRRFLLLIILTGISVPVSDVIAVEVYKWVDEQGLTHYGDKPLADDAVEVEINHPSGGDEETLKRMERRDRLLQVYEDERRLKKEEELEARQEREKDKQLCIQAKTELENLNFNGPLYRLNEEGERIFLSDDDRETERAYWQKQVKKYC